MANEGDLKAHEHTYSGFISWAKWGTIICAIIALIVIFIIRN